MPNTKQLIVSFLILSLVVSSGVFAASLFVSNNTAHTAQENNDQRGGGPNYDARRPATNIQTGTPGTTTQEQPSPPQTLTEQFADTIAKHIVEGNPSGPQATTNGTSVQIPADADKRVEEFLSQQTVQLDSNAIAVDSSKIKRVGESHEALAGYVTKLDAILAGFRADNSRVFSQTPTKQSIRAVRLVVDETKTSLYNTAVPERFYPFHRSLLKSLEIQSYWLRELERDPLRGTAIATQAIQATNQALEEVRVATQNLSNDTTKKGEGVSALLGIQTAHALTVADVLNWATHMYSYFLQTVEWFQKIYEWYDKYAKEYLKNTYVNIIVNAIIKYAVLGEEAPRIVTNWQNFLQGTVNAVAGAFIEELAPGLCSPFSGQLRLLLDQPRLTPPISSCTLTQVINNIENLYNSFENGSWIGYSLAWSPTNNYYGQYWQQSQEISILAQAAKEAARAKAEAGAGNLGTEVCDNGLAPGEAPDDFVGPVQPGKCADGSDPTITTPGRNLSDLTSKGLGSAIDRIVNADTFDALIAFFLDAAIGKLFASGNDGLLQGDIANRPGGGAAALCQSYEEGTLAYQECIQNVEDPDFVRDEEVDPTVPTSPPEDPFSCIDYGGDGGGGFEAWDIGTRPGEVIQQDGDSWIFEWNSRTTGSANFQIGDDRPLSDPSVVDLSGWTISATANPQGSNQNSPVSLERTFSSAQRAASTQIPAGEWRITARVTPGEVSGTRKDAFLVGFPETETADQLFVRVDSNQNLNWRRGQFSEDGGAATGPIVREFFTDSQYVVPPDRDENGNLTQRDRRFLIIPTGEQGHFTRATLEFDFFLTEFDVEAPHFSHGLFEMRNEGGNREPPDPHFSSGIGLTDGDINSGNLGNASGGFAWGTGKNHLKKTSANWTENTWYTFRAVYDAEEDSYAVEARERETGDLVAVVFNQADYSLYSQGNGFKLILHGRNILGDIPGSEGENVHHMEGAIYENVRVALEPGEPVCTKSTAPVPSPPSNVPGAGDGNGDGGGGGGGGDDNNNDDGGGPGPIFDL